MPRTLSLRAGRSLLCCIAHHGSKRGARTRAQGLECTIVMTSLERMDWLFQYSQSLMNWPETTAQAQVIMIQLLKLWGRLWEDWIYLQVLNLSMMALQRPWETGSLGLEHTLITINSLERMRLPFPWKANWMRGSQSTSRDQELTKLKIRDLKVQGLGWVKLPGLRRGKSLNSIWGLASMTRHIWR